MTFITIAAASLAGAYLTAIVLQVVHGLPRPWYKCLSVVRCVKILYALWQHLASVVYLPLYLRWKRFYTSEIAQQRIHKHITFGIHDNALDVYAVRSGEEGPHAKPKPVMVFVYGGAWGSGNKEMYTLFANRFATEGFVVVVPDYTLFPRGNVTNMVLDVVHCLEWTLEHIAEYGGDPSNLSLIGHSAGGHLCALAAIQIESELRARTTVFRPTCPHDHMKSIPLQSLSKIRSSLRAVIGLSGVYHIGDHFLHEAKRGVEYISPMWRAMLGHDNFDRFSPAHILESIVAEDAGHHKLLHLPAFVLVHGEQDGTVPDSSSQRFARALQAAGVRSVALHILPETGHADVVLAPMCEGLKGHRELVALILHSLSALTQHY